MLLLSLLRPLKGTSLAGNVRFEPSLVAVRCAVRPGRWAKSTKIKKVAQNLAECMAKIWVFAQTPAVNRSFPNFAFWFVYRMRFLVWSSERSGENVGAVGSKFRLSHWKGTSLIQQLAATAQAAMYCSCSLTVSIRRNNFAAPAASCCIAACLWLLKIAAYIVYFS